MSNSPRYSLLPGPWQTNGRVNTLLIIHGTPVPVVPVGSCLLLLVGLIMWSVGMLQARTTVDGIFSDLGMEADSLDQLKATVLAAVIVLLVLALLMLAANVWLEVGHSSSKATTGLSSLQAYASNTFRVNVCNWVLLLLVALAMAGSITWLTTMSTALSAVQETGGGGYGSSRVWTSPSSSSSSSSNSRKASWKVHQAAKVEDGSYSGVEGRSHSSDGATRRGGYSLGKGVAGAGRGYNMGVPQGEATATAAASSTAGAVALPSNDASDIGQVWASSSSNACPPGCVDLGLIAKVFGLPWPCFCQVWLLGDLMTQLQQVVGQLWVAVSGALLLFVSTSWLYGYLAAQAAHAARDLQQQQSGMQAATEA